MTVKTTTPVGWTEAQEKTISGFMEAEGITRGSAIRKMRRVETAGKTPVTMKAKTVKAPKAPVARTETKTKTGIRRRTYDTAKIAELHAAGKTPEQIAEQMDLLLNGVNYYLNKLGLVNLAAGRKAKREAKAAEKREAATAKVARLELLKTKGAERTSEIENGGVQEAEDLAAIAEAEEEEGDSAR